MDVGPSSPVESDPAIRAFLEQSGLVKTGEAAQLVPLTGGVASDIFRVELGDRRFVVKRALARLRVEQEWNAPVSRNASEVGWFIEAQRAVSNAVPKILAHNPAAGVFAMTYLDPATYPIWKNELRDGRISQAFAAAVGQAIVAVHQATARSADVARRFRNDETFHAIRLEPYLEATARRHSDLAEELYALSREAIQRKLALVHGDVSPKNILAGPAGPILLDAECAWYGEPAFDLAFCLNHLLLKCVWKRQHATRYIACFDALSAAYLSGVQWERPEDLEARAARLLPALLLGRVDGKSPVEYITTEADRERVRQVARRLIARCPRRLAHVRDQWAKEILP
ncbi:aminoglycoside phosphotransferase family protein [Methylobacterium mesophilicum SR1.6/6]|uniref:Aminoglycoside phosphotransferase family protein n=1 Tax=Methylobacterium mesophilicum SR1.6/6 TaxID=908290 RepID=A0A6B9FMS5_9HYPH|nr:aminoglycoside phosphotransferase family protein [Methylobacterium mesophilicum]QGY03016.1 aminoglycoside phosphotransferase family protein [Methylobacterium mesophilicum SR1.6/6]